MKIIHLCLISVSTLLGCANKTETPVLLKTTDTTTKTMKSGTFTYLALGDSYTIGESVPQSQSYPYQLRASLNADGLNLLAPDIIAVTGWTTDNLIDAIGQSSFKEKKYDLVTLLIGVNDQYQQLSKDNYRIKFVQVLNTAIAFANGDKSRVFVLSIPDWGVTPFAGGRESVIGPNIDAFNAINKDETTKAHVTYVDITLISRLAANNSALIATDGLHPSGEMYAEWVRVLEPMVIKRF